MLRFLVPALLAFAKTTPHAGKTPSRKKCILMQQSETPTPPTPMQLLDRVGITETKTANKPLTAGEEAARFSLKAQSTDSWKIFAAAVSAVLSALYVLWIRADTGYGDDFIAGLENICRGNSHLVTLALGIIFPVVHSGLASLRPSGEKIVGARAWRVLFACSSLPLAYSWIVYFIAHRYDGIVLWNLQSNEFAHNVAWFISFLSFFFLYPSTFNLLEIAAVEKPKLHLWETGVVRVTRHPQFVGQCMWSAAHLAMVGSTFTALTMSLLVAHHAFATWNGDRRLREKHGELFDKVQAKTSVTPFAAILDGRQQLPTDYYKEWVRAPYVLIVVGTIGAYLAHPYMQAGAALVQNTGLISGGVLG